MEEDRKPREAEDASATPKAPGDNEEGTKGVEDKVGCHAIFSQLNWRCMSLDDTDLCRSRSI